MSLPLEGIRVLDLSRLLPGGFCSCLLSDFGADVIKVEDTGAGDYARWTPPRYEGADPSAIVFVSPGCIVASKEQHAKRGRDDQQHKRSNRHAANDNRGEGPLHLTADAM